jgi:hypothetical protein
MDALFDQRFAALDRYAARCVISVLVTTRRAVLARGARQEILATSRERCRISMASPWLVGPLEGTRDALLVLRASGPSEIVERLASDPWTAKGLLVTKQISPWQLRLGSLP